MLIHEVTEWERLALARFALADPSTFALFVCFALHIIDDAANEEISRSAAPLAAKWDLDRCHRCFEQVVYDLDGLPYEWPPEAHRCPDRPVALREWKSQ